MSNLLRLRLLEYLAQALALQAQAQKMEWYMMRFEYRFDAPALILLIAVEAQHLRYHANNILWDVFYRLQFRCEP